MTRKKSFPIDDAELGVARRNAERLGVSLNRYLLDAVVEKNEGRTSVQRMEQIERRMVEVLDTFRQEMVRTRLDIRMDADHLLDVMREQNHKTLTTNEAQMKAFIGLLARQYGVFQETPLAPSRRKRDSVDDLLDRPMGPPVVIGQPTT